MAQIVDTFGDFIFEEPQTGGGTPISNATDFPPGFIEEPQTGGGTPISVGSGTYTPFKLTSRLIDTIQIQKIYDTFPRLLRVQQLTSNELLEQLRNEVRLKDDRIQELLDLLASTAADSTDLTELENTIAGISLDTTDILNQLQQDLEEDVEDSNLQTQINQLLADEYTRIGQTLLFVKVYANVQTDPNFINIPFVASQINRGRLSVFNPMTKLSPSQVEFKNIGNDTVYFARGEVWNNNSDGLGLPGNPTNVFEFSTYPDEATVYTIQGNSEITQTISLGYFPQDRDYDDIGLNDGNQDKTIYTGNVFILASNENIAGSIDKSRLEKNGTSIGACKVQRRA